MVPFLYKSKEIDKNIDYKKTNLNMLENDEIGSLKKKMD